MMAVTDIREEFLRVLDEDPEFRQRVRRRILSAELIELPERLAELAQQFAAFASHVNEFITEQRLRNIRQEEFNTEMRQFVEEQRDVNARVDGRLDQMDERLDRVDGQLDRMDGRLDRMDGRLDRMDGRLDQVDKRLDRMDGRLDQVDEHLDRVDGRLDQVDERLQTITAGLGDLKGHAAGRAVRDHFEAILDQLGLKYVKLLSRHDLIAMLGRAPDIPAGTRQSFFRADLVLQAADADGATHYVAAEASYTADRRDTDRSVRNAGFLERFTSCPAHAVVASVQNDRAVQALVDDGTVHWYQFAKRDLTPE